MYISLGSIVVLLLLHYSHAAKGEPPLMDEDAQTRFRIPKGTKNFKLVCPIIGDNHNIIASWTRNGETLDFDFDRTYKVAREGREVRIKNVRLEDSGRFECQAVNGFGHRSIHFVLQVFDPATEVVTLKDRVSISNASSQPHWLDEGEMQEAVSRPVRVNIGGKLEMRCAAQGNPLPEIRWFKNNELIPQNGPIDSAVFTLESVTPGNSGDYRCEVFNKLGTKSATFKVLVADFFDANEEERAGLEDDIHRPQIDSPYNISVQRGRTAQFTCKARAVNSPVIKWLKELSQEEADSHSRGRKSNTTIIKAIGKQLTVIEERQKMAQETINGEKYLTNRLVIPSADYEDAGKYYCVVTTTAGHIVYRTAELLVERGIVIGNMSLSASTFWYVAVPVAGSFVFLVICGIVYLRAAQVNDREKQRRMNGNKPPPPSIPLPPAPADNISVYGHNTLQHYSMDKPQSPMILRDAYFQQKPQNSLERMTTPHRLHRGVREEDMMHSPHFVASPQASPMYWAQSGKSSAHQPLLLPAPQVMDSRSMGHHHLGHHTIGYQGIQYPSLGHHQPAPSYASGNYRTLDMAYSRDPHPSLYSSEYTDHLPFISTPRHDL